MRSAALVAAAAATATAAAACRDREAAPAPRAPAADAPADADAWPSHDDELDDLHALEARLHAETDFAARPPSDVALGPDPYRIAAVPGERVLIGLLRGEAAVVALAPDGTELARLPAPRSPSGLAVSAGGDVLVVGEAARELAHYRVRDGRLARVASVPIDALGLRDVAVSADGATAYVVEERGGRLLAIGLARDAAGALRRTGMRELGRCHGPTRVAALADAVVVSCVLDRALEIRRADGAVVRIAHDGPLWGFALHREPDGGLVVAAGGVEDHPLERADGGFGYIDSYLYLYRLAPGAARAARLATINASALGAVTPKWLALRAGPAPGALALATAGYASASLLTLTWTGDLAAPPRVERAALVPGTADAAVAADGTLVTANPLFDAWVAARGGGRGEPRVVPVASERPARAVASRVGELLFFTTLMAPWNATDGKRSRFTCETCHHEGYVDGRVHYTGRDDVHVATRPLLGLFNNRPHFSRALDETTTVMVHAEFRVANRHNGRDPWFALAPADVPWLRHVADAPRAPLTPAYLREALLAFLFDFTHRTNPAAAGRAAFTPTERAGAGAFRARCEPCHAARLVADDERTAVPFERWEALVLSPAGPIVWGQAAYHQTGVTPYVHADGARVPSLRRLYKKWPYFTNGSTRSLDDVLDRFAWSAARAYHDGAPPGAEVQRLDARERAALRAFLDLL